MVKGQQLTTSSATQCPEAKTHGHNDYSDLPASLEVACPTVSLMVKSFAKYRSRRVSQFLTQSSRSMSYVDPFTSLKAAYSGTISMDKSFIEHSKATEMK